MHTSIQVENLTRVFNRRGAAPFHALRGVSSLLLTDLTALDYDALGRTLEFLANNGAAVEAQALPGRWDAASGTYTVTDASRAAVQTFFNVSPTEAQASSFKEP